MKNGDEMIDYVNTATAYHEIRQNSYKKEAVSSQEKTAVPHWPGNGRLSSQTIRYTPVITGG
jgi:hypothetical protein